MLEHWCPGMDMDKFVTEFNFVGEVVREWEDIVLAYHWEEGWVRDFFERGNKQFLFWVQIMAMNATYSEII